MMMMIQLQIPWGKIRTRRKGERDGKEIQEGCYGVTTTNQTGWKEGAMVYVWFTPLRFSLLWLFGEREHACYMPSLCYCRWNSCTARDRIGTATRSPTTAGTKPGGPSPLLPFMLGHLYFHKCPIKTACTLGNKKQMEYQGMWWLEPLSKLLPCLCSAIQTLTLRNCKQIKRFLLYVALILVFYHCNRIVISKLLRLIPEPTVEGEDRQPNIVLWHPNMHTRPHTTYTQ